MTDQGGRAVEPETLRIDSIGNPGARPNGSDIFGSTPFVVEDAVFCLAGQVPAIDGQQVLSFCFGWNDACDAPDDYQAAIA